MDIKFYKTTASSNCLNKAITDEKIKTGHLKDGCDILNPVIEFAYDSSLLSYNYAKIEAFNRFYYITDTVVVGKILEIHFKVDVLTTYSTDIKNSVATITRSNAGDKFLPDKRVTKKSGTNIELKKLGVGFLLSDTYIVTVGGN